jgi:hypothetical protein
MAKAKKMWVFSPPKQAKSKVPEAVKTHVRLKAQVDRILLGNPRCRRVNSQSRIASFVPDKELEDVVIGCRNRKGKKV